MDLRSGLNQAKLLLQRVFCLVLGIRNGTKLPDDAFEAMTIIGCKYSKGLMDLPPVLRRVDQYYIEKCRSLMPGIAIKYVMIAREEKPAAMLDVAVNIAFIKGKVLTERVRWQAVEPFDKVDCRVIQIDEPAAVGRVIIKTPFPAAIWLVDKEGASHFQYAVEPTLEFRELTLYPGRYVVLPQMTSLLKRTRSRSLDVMENASVSLDLSDGESFGWLQATVFDRSGQATNEYCINVEGGGKDVLYTGMSTEKKALMLACEVGEYKLQVFDSVFGLAEERVVVVRAGPAPTPVEFTLR